VDWAVQALSSPSKISYNATTAAEEDIPQIVSAGTGTFDGKTSRKDISIMGPIDTVKTSDGPICSSASTVQMDGDLESGITSLGYHEGLVYQDHCLDGISI